MNIIQKVKSIKVDTLRFFSDFYKNAIDNLMEMSVKCQDLKKTNIELANHHLTNGNLSDAIFRYWVLINVLKYDNEQILYNIGRAYLYKESRIKALEFFEKALKKNPKNKLCAFRIQALTHPDSVEIIPIEIVKEDYDVSANTYKKFITSSKYRAPQILFEELKSFVTKHDKKNEYKPQNMIDLGCGFGICGFLAKTDFNIENVFGIDISAKMLSEAKILNETDKIFQEFFNKNFLTFNQYGHKFDLIIACFSLQFSLDLKDTIKMIKSISNKGAYFAFAVPSTNKKHSSYDINQRQFEYTKSDLEKVMLHEKFSDFTLSTKKISDSTTAFIIVAKK